MSGLKVGDRAQFNAKALENFQGVKVKAGQIVGESRDLQSWRFKRDGMSTETWHKDFLEPEDGAA